MKKLLLLLLCVPLIFSCGEQKDNDTENIQKGVNVQKDSILFYDTLLIVSDDTTFFYDDKLFNGVMYNSYENGQIEFSCEIKDGKHNGINVSYYPNGQLIQKINFKDGKEDGLSKKYYENGQLMQEGYAVNGKQDGLWKFYYENGQLGSKLIIKYGKVVSEDYWNKEGDIVDRNTFYN